MNFSTLQGLTIPEGVVTQIADASGNVLWSAVPAFDGFVYLRPSADISVDSTITFQPSTATAAYMLINEEVSDMSSTQIMAKPSAEITNVSGNARFSLEGYVPETISKVLDFNVAISGTCPGSTVDVDGIPTNGSSITPYFSFNGVDIECDFFDSAVSDLFQGASYSVVNPIAYRKLGTSGYYEDVEKEVILAEINDYISANGVLPDFELRIYLHARYIETTDSAGKADSFTGYAYVSQAYIVLECE